MKKFEVLEHTADAYLAAYGKSLEEAFENAALAMFETMTETRRVRPELEEEVEVAGHDEPSLLYNWLEELLIRFETSGNLYSKFKVLKIERTPEGLRLKARIWGEPFDPERHPQKVGVKAVTYHRMEVVKEPERVVLRFILDI